MIQSFYVNVSEHHQLAVVLAGNPRGIPVLFLHGGPGAGCKLDHLAYFDLERYWVVLWDQRGSGRSLPHGELRDNTTQHLLADIEWLRRELGVSQWLLFGGSWGSFLALTYAIHYPAQVSGMVLRSICLGRQLEHDWLYRAGAHLLFPQAWQSFRQWLPHDEREDMLQAYYTRLMHEDHCIAWRAAWHWSCWAMACLELPLPAEPQEVEIQKTWLRQVRLEVHYFYHQLFLPKHFVCDHLTTLRHLPLAIVHGSHDFLCPPDNAYALHQAMPASHLTMVEGAGHLSSAPGMFEALQAGLGWVGDRLPL